MITASVRSSVGGSVRGAVGPAGGESVDLTSGLISWWDLDEASGNRADSHGSNTLTDNATVTSATGKVSDAADFEATNGEWLSKAAPHGCGFDSITDITIACWVNFESLAVDAGIMRVGNSTTASAHDWMLYSATSASRLRFYIPSSSAFSGRFVDANSHGNLSTSTWYFVIGQYDASAETAFISVNAGTLDSQTGLGSPNSSGSQLELGRFDTGNYYDGLIDEAAVWNRLLNQSEINTLYNSGSGIAYPG